MCDYYCDCEECWWANGEKEICATCDCIVGEGCGCDEEPIIPTKPLNILPKIFCGGIYFLYQNGVLVHIGSNSNCMTAEIKWHFENSNAINFNQVGWIETKASDNFLVKSVSFLSYWMQPTFKQILEGPIEKRNLTEAAINKGTDILKHATYIKTEVKRG